MKAWWKNLPLHIKLHLPIQLVLLVFLPIAHIWVMNQYESAMLDDIQRRTEGGATQSLLALNSVMLSGSIKSQNDCSEFFKRISVQKGLEEFHIVRADAVQRQYGPGLEPERQSDELERLAATTNSVQTAISREGKHSLRVVVPFAAIGDFHGVNCLQCHKVPEGAVLGTISQKINLDQEYSKLQRLGSVLLEGQIFLQLLFFFLIGWLTRSITRSVVNLENDMLHIRKEEDFSKRADVDGNDEIGQIARVFNGFVAYIEELHLRLAEKIVALEKCHDQTVHDSRIGGDILSRIADAQSMIDPAVRSQIKSATLNGGDIFLLSRTPADTLQLMVADAVGPGLVAALNLLPLTQIFNAMSRKGFSVSRIAGELNSKIHRLMPEDHYMGTALVSIDFRHRVIEVWNGGLPAPLLVHKDGTVLHEWPSRNPPLGILDDESFSSEVEIFHYDNDCQLFLFFDGLPEAESCDGVQFGKERIEQLFHGTEPERRFDMLMDSLAQHLHGQLAHDDISLAMVNIAVKDVQKSLSPVIATSCVDETWGNNWRLAIRLGENELKHLDAVSLVTQAVSKISASAEHNFHLYVILNELFNNALDHGVLELDSAIKQGPDGFEKYLKLRDEKLHALAGGSIEIEIEEAVIQGHKGVKIHLLDSGNGFDYSAIQDAARESLVQGQHGRGLALVKSLTRKLVFSGKGNEVTAYYACD